MDGQEESIWLEQLMLLFQEEGQSDVSRQSQDGMEGTGLDGSLYSKDSTCWLRNAVLDQVGTGSSG